MSIVNECMVVNVQISMWTGYRLDKDMTKKVVDDANASEDAARVNKHLVPKEVLKPVVSAANAVRLHFYKYTLPWKDNGDRLLPRNMYMQFMQEHSHLVDEFNNAVTKFLGEDYPKVIDQAAFRMGALFKPEDYPSSGALRNKFNVNLDIDAVTEANDFRVVLDTDKVNAIKADMEAAMQQRINRAMQDIWTRLHETLGHFADKMQSDEIFRNSTVTNLEELVDMIPKLNFTNDPDLEAIRQEILGAIIGYTPKELRTDETARRVAAEDAKRIHDKMAGFMKAFGWDQ